MTYNYFNYYYNGWLVSINDYTNCISISNPNLGVKRIDFPTEKEAIEYIDDFDEEG